MPDNPDAEEFYRWIADLIPRLDPYRERLAKMGWTDTMAKNFIAEIVSEVICHSLLSGRFKQNDAGDPAP